MICGPRKGQESPRRAKATPHTTSSVGLAGTKELRIPAACLRDSGKEQLPGVWISPSPKSRLPSEVGALRPMPADGAPCSSLLEDNDEGGRSPRGSKWERGRDRLTAHSSVRPTPLVLGSLPRAAAREGSPPPGTKGFGGVVATPPRQQWGTVKDAEGYFGSPRPPDAPPNSGKELGGSLLAPASDLSDGAQQDCPAEELGEGQALQQQLPKGKAGGKAPYDPIHYLTTIMEVCHDCPCWRSALPSLLDDVLEKVRAGEDDRQGTPSLLCEAVLNCINVTTSPGCTNAAIIDGMQSIQHATNGAELSKGRLATLQAALCGS